MAPILLWIFYIFGFSLDSAIKTAFGTSLFIGSLTALTGFFIHKERIGPRWEIVIPLIIPLVIGAFIGSFVASALSGNFLKIALGIALFIISIHMIMSSVQEAHYNIPKLSRHLLIFTGLLIGFFASLVGMGGAIFTFIVFVGLFKYPVHKTVGITTFVQTLGALSGAIGYLVNGYINWRVAIWMLAGSIPCAYLGALMAHRLEANWLKRAFGILLIFIAIRTLHQVR